jgi:8-oxo-dGTP pyrophosphatase MutT (NUDIX family)
VEASPSELAGLAEALSRLAARADEAVPATRKAAVAAILREGAGGVELLFIRRAEHPRDPWSGQMGLPGGRVDPGDGSPRAAAVRETREEIGLDLETLGRPLGRLSEVRTHLPLGSVPHSVVPFVYGVEGDPSLRPNAEVQEALWVPLAFLSDRAHRSAFTWVRKGLPLPMPCTTYRGRVIWGLTLKIVDELVGLREGGSPSVPDDSVT